MDSWRSARNMTAAATLRLSLTALAAAGIVIAIDYARRRRRWRLRLVAGRQIRPREITMGAIWIGPGGGPFGDGGRPDLGHANAVATVRACLDAGIREFDTAPWYGSGASEERLGRALRELQEAGFPPALDGVRVTTKVGRLVRTPDGEVPAVPFDAQNEPPLASRRFVNNYTAGGARLSFRESAARLGVHAVHGLRVHDPNDNSLNRRGDPGGWVDEVAMALGGSDGGCLAELRRMRAEGTIAEVSFGMNSNFEAHIGVPDEIVRLVRHAPAGTFDAALLAGGWNLLSQAGLPCFEECARRGIGVHVAGVFASGLLVGGDTYAYKEAPTAKRELAADWATLAAEHGLSLPAVAIAFAALPSCVTRIVLGMATSEQVRQNLEWVREAGMVPPQLWLDAQRRGLVAASLPIPAL